MRDVGAFQPILDHMDRHRAAWKPAFAAYCAHIVEMIETAMRDTPPPPPADALAVLDGICQALPKYVYSVLDERRLHSAIGNVLHDAKIGYLHEHVAGPKDRFDFYCEGNVVIEVKTLGSYHEAMRQVARYCERDDVAACVLATSRAWAWTLRSDESTLTLAGKPVRVVALRTAF